MNNLQKISCLVLIGVVGYFIYIQINKKPKIVQTKNPQKTSGGMFSMTQNNADKIAAEIKDIYDVGNEQGGLTKFHSGLIQPLLKQLTDNGYEYSNGKAVKKNK